MLKIKTFKFRLAGFFLILAFVTGCEFSRNMGADRLDPDGNMFASKRVTVVPYVDLKRYLGTWYEIARYPHRFQENCYASLAQYTQGPDGTIRVLNQCRLGSLDGKLKEAKGKAWVTDKLTNAKLKVQFFWPFSGLVMIFLK